MKLMAVYFLVLCYSSSLGQDALAIIAKVKAAQSSLLDVSYIAHRIDSFTNGDIWDKTGRCQVRLVQSDTALGFHFWGKRDDIDGESLYDGKVAYTIDHVAKNYEAITNVPKIPNILGSPGGQMVFRDLFDLDTTHATRFEVTQDQDRFILKMIFPDNKRYDVLNRYRIVFIDKKTMLPFEEIDHLEILRKIQHRHILIRSLRINDRPSVYSFENKDFLFSHAQEVHMVGPGLTRLLGREIPVFKLNDFNVGTISSVDLKGKIVLLDFWAIWCGPCVASLPKVDALFAKYKTMGLEVFGVMVDQKDLAAAKLWVQKHPVSFKMLVGDEKVKEDFSVDSIPLYILVDKNGTISFISEGYSDEIETKVQQLLKN